LPRSAESEILTLEEYEGESPQSRFGTGTKGEVGMSEAAGRAEMEHRLVQRSLEDDVFRQQLLSDPRAIIEREIGTQLPAEVTVVAVEETADTIYLVLPSSSPIGAGGQLSDEELESVAGGWESSGGMTCAGNTCVGPCFTNWSTCPAE
jgi:hypothetical protein